MLKNKYIAILAKGASGSFAIKIIGMGVAFLLQLYLARLLKVDEFGVYVYVITWMNLLLLLVTHGWDTSTIRYVSEYFSKCKWGLLKGFLITSRLFTFVSSFFISIMLITYINLAEPDALEGMLLIFLVGCFILPVNSWLQLYAASIQGIKQVVLSQLPQNVIRPLLFISILLVLSFSGNIKLDAYYTMLVNFASGIITLVVTVVIFHLMLRKKSKPVVAEYKVNEWFNTAIPLLMVSGFIMLMNRLDILMLGSMAGTSEAGIYSVSSRIAELTSFGLIAVNTVMAPMIADLYASKKHIELQQIVSQSVLGISVITLFIGFVLVFFGEFIISLFGSGFAAGVFPLYILVAGQFINSMSGSSGFLMSMTGHQRIAAYILGFVALLNAVLNYLLIPIYSMEGAAFATAISMVIWNIMMVLAVRKKTGIYSTIFSIRRAFR